MRTLVILISVLLPLAAFGADFGSAITTSVQSWPASVDLAGMGGQNICVPTPSGSNPAQYPTLEDFECKTAPFVAEYLFDFDKGPDVNMTITTVTTKAGPGFLRLNYYQLKSLNRDSRGLLVPQNISGETAEIGYGLKLSDKLMVGASITPLLKSTSEVYVGRLKLGSGTVKGEFTSTLGILYRPTKKISLGLCYNYSLQTIKSRQFGQTTREEISTDFLRAGIAVQPWKGATFGAEWLGGRIDNKSVNDVYPQKWFFGGEQWLDKHIAIRVGCMDGKPTAGLGIALGKKPSLFIDYAFVANPAGDMKPFWGDASAHLLSVCYAF